MFLYDGNEIVDLLGDKIEKSKFPLAYQRYFEFDGTASHITRDAQAISAYPFTLACRFRTSATGGNMVDFADKSESNVYYYIGISGDGKVDIVVRNTGLVFASSTASFNDGEWHTAVGIFTSATERELFVDNASVATSTTSVTFAAGVDRMNVGRSGRVTPTDYFNGGLTDVMVDDATWSSSQRTEYENGLVPTGVQNSFPAKKVSDATWLDSTASFDLTVNGATAIFEDSWESFYTDYSQTGYHGKTNTVIIMRDCTGKWSSGQDYSDAWMIDLDTGANTTSRRMFTKGTVYSNFTTDWRHDLIIAEQTSSTSVTIKKITDEPQSQAVGLIDLRTADFDFGNPATRKDIDAIIITYKSSATQTNPVSYALEDNDAPTAWTRLTGDFDAETNWEKLVIEPTPIACDSIRFKVDNPTASGTIEINDITIRYIEYPEALS